MNKLEAPCYTCFKFLEIPEEDVKDGIKNVIICHECLTKLTIEDLASKVIDGKKCILIKKGKYKWRSQI